MIPVEPSHNRAIGPGCIGSSFNLPQRDTLYAPRQKQYQVPISGAKPFVTDPTDLAGDPRTRTQYVPSSLKMLTTCHSSAYITLHALSRYPYVTGASVIAVKCKKGVLIACDTLGETLLHVHTDQGFLAHTAICTTYAQPHQGDDDQKLDLIIESSCRCSHSLCCSSVRPCVDMSSMSPVVQVVCRCWLANSPGNNIRRSRTSQVSFSKVRSALQGRMGLQRGTRVYRGCSRSMTSA